jgi:SET domain-containing protein
MERIEIKESPIHGLGVFAKIDIKVGEKICDYIGIEMSWKEFTSIYGPYKENSLNTYPMRRIWRIIVAKDEPFKSTNIVNFINEGPANVVLKKKALHTLREIKAGEELLLQYPKDYKREWI